MDIKHIFAATMIAGVSLASTASALTITSIDGVWENASAGVSGEGTNQIRWGDGWEGGDPSGYDFTSASTDLEAQENTSFVLGTFDHLNLPVTGTFLETVDLAVSLTIDGVADAISTVFSFEHNETKNGRKTCANGEKNKQGVNINGCADHVTATINEGKSQSFEIDGVTYFLDILGFQYDGELLQDFWTVENEINSAELVAIFRTEGGENPPPPPIDPPSEVPLPASGLLLLAGVAGLYAKKKRAS